MARRPGYDKYYLSVDCSNCGAYTGKEYAYRFGESKPTVYCGSCTRKRQRRAVSAFKHPQNHRAEVFCGTCKRHLETLTGCSSNAKQYRTCVACQAEKKKEKKEKEEKELNAFAATQDPPQCPVFMSNDDIVDAQFAIQ
jgi:hypothetical protein